MYYKFYYGTVGDENMKTCTRLHAEYEEQYSYSSIVVRTTSTTKTVRFFKAKQLDVLVDEYFVLNTDSSCFAKGSTTQQILLSTPEYYEQVVCSHRKRRASCTGLLLASRALVEQRVDKYSE